MARGVGTQPSAALPPAFSHEALALTFAMRHASDLRYVAAREKWLRWAGVVWRTDETLFAVHEARAICREAAAACNTDRSVTLASAGTVAAVERLARADRRLAATVDQWDSDAWLLNTPGGVIDLRTGLCRPHRPRDYITKVTAVAPGGDCPQFEAFLDRITASDVALQQYLQRVLGYGLTGITRDHAMFFAFGTGANGKSVLLETVADIFGSYHRTAPMETFVASSSDRHPTELAALQGARLVTATETEEGRHWAEAKIKAMTGGDTIAARFMRQDYFEFRPQFKMFVSGNHKPRLRSVDESIRRRLNLIPFVVTIPENERDKTLKEKLRAEWPGILQWMIDGCREWQRIGLAPPERVREATEDYLRAEDTVAEWIADCCSTAPCDQASSSELFASFEPWARAAGDPGWSQKRFSQALEGKRFEKARGGTGRQLFKGIALKA